MGEPNGRKRERRWRECTIKLSSAPPPLAAAPVYKRLLILFNSEVIYLLVTVPSKENTCLPLII